MRRFTLTVADNGWIVRVTDYQPGPRPAGTIEMPAPQLIVFREWDALLKWIAAFSKGAV